MYIEETYWVHKCVLISGVSFKRGSLILVRIQLVTGQ